MIIAWLLCIGGALGMYVAVHNPALITNHLYHTLGLHILFGD